MMIDVMFNHHHESRFPFVDQEFEMGSDAPLPFASGPPVNPTSSTNLNHVEFPLPDDDTLPDLVDDDDDSDDDGTMSEFRVHENLHGLYHNFPLVFIFHER